MAQRRSKPNRDVERDYPARHFVAKLRRLADCIEGGQRFRIQIGGERISVPPTATINIEHERSSSNEEIEFQLVWKLDDRSDARHSIARPEARAGASRRPR